MTDFALILESGLGDQRFSRPSVEWQMSGEFHGLELSSITRLALDDWDSQRFEIKAPISRHISLTGQYYSGTNGHGADTVQLVSKLKLSDSPFTLTASYSPDAFGAGERYRVGGQAVFRRGDVSAWAWVTVRYLPRFDLVDQESWYSLNYHIDDTRTISLRRFDSDFFGDNVTLRVTQTF